MDIRMNKEIQDYKETTFGIFTLRQTICAGIMCLLAVFFAFRLKSVLDQNLMLFLYLILAAPFLVIGDFFGSFFKKNYGTNTYGFVVMVFRYLVEPRQLKYVGRNVIAEMAKEQKEEAERRERIEKIRKALSFRGRKAHDSDQCTENHSSTGNLEGRDIPERQDVQ